jgi:hypothetical protein
MLSDMVGQIVAHLRNGTQVQIAGLGLLQVSERGSVSPKTPDKRYLRYIRERTISIDPQHNALESAFKHFLAEQKATQIVWDTNYVDVRFRDRKYGQVIAELKPAKPNETCYAIRIGVGQVLEYRHYLSKNKDVPMIVLGAEPKPREKDFVSSIGIALGWQTGTGFEINWPVSPISQ